MTVIRKRLSNWYFSHKHEKTPGEYLAEFMGNSPECSLTGDVYPRGELYIAGAVRGHYLDDDIATAFVQWLKDTHNIIF